MSRRYGWRTRFPFKLPRVRRRASSVAAGRALFDSMKLAIEAQRVVNLRLAAMARGDAQALIEAQRMVAEKLAASTEAARMLARGASNRALISFYRAKVKANTRRLSKKPSLLRRSRTSC
jgi:hypothetical protein